MSITSDISIIVAAKYPDAHFILSSWFKANRQSFDIAEMTLDTPLIILNNEISKDKEIQLNSNILAGTRIQMQFLVKGDVYQSDIDMNTAIEALEVIADNVFMQIYLLDSIRLRGSEIQQYRITPKFKIYNSVLVGVEAEGRFKENQVRNVCSSGIITADNNVITADSIDITADGGVI